MSDTADLENGLLGFSNPNYQLDDAVNCNTAPDDGLYDELYLQELDSVCNYRRGPSVKNRRGYASLDLSSMGIDLTTGSSPAASNARDTNRNTELESTSVAATTEVMLDNNTVPNNEIVGRSSNGLLDYYLTGNQQTWPDLLESTDQQQDSEVRGMDINSPDSSDSGIQENNSMMAIPHVAGQLSNELYALPIKRKATGSPPPPSDDKLSPISRPKSCTELDGEDLLPSGWQKHEDNDGPYYWHIKSGTIQRDPPPPNPPNVKETKRSISKESDSTESCPSSSASETTPSTIETNGILPQKEDNNYKRRSFPRAESEKEKPIRFAVRSLGWVEIAEEDLTPERSSKAVNKCIVDLSLGRNDILDVVGRWGDGKDLFMDLDDHSLKLIDPENLALLNTQPIHTIRVWGVGRDNGRDFAYVARDRASRKHMCHVFRCDTSARTIANTLRDICKKIMLERSLSQGLGRGNHGESGSSRSGASRGTPSGRGGLARPTNLPTEHRRFHHRMPHTSYSAQSFPTPMEEPKKVLKVRYVGMMQVPKATGMDVLNLAIDQLSATPVDQWQYVNVAVAPSTITISAQGDEGRQIAECRVRFLSFLGIGKNVKQCGFIMHTAQDEFIAHIFYCEPTSGALCKTIEAACKLRYQKCLDAHPQGMDRKNGEGQSNRGLAATVKSMLGSLAIRKARSADS